ncbi:Cellulase 1 [Streptomyces sp. RB5]|uniref:Endoglucanase n=1 Tax=Streptomyces smaragdinus TaxID=2585196 RepID=A0A7K0CRT3_9ACTN|nr:glycoside hydrolase family 9 protein [Streptomyces smaragdinus]MQY16130.1 Cellulase 1 [Streptomyces smaragdinus]
MRRPRTVVLALISLLAAGLSALPAATAGAAEVEQVRNGTFDTGTDPWWTSNVTAVPAEGELCAEIPGGTANRWDSIIGQNDLTLVEGESYRFSFRATGTPGGNVARAVVGLQVEPYTTYFEVSPQINVSGDVYSYTFTSPMDTAQAQVALQVGGNAADWNLCLDDVSLLGGVPPEVYEPDTGPRVRVNQVAYTPHGPKNATVVTEATEPLPYELKNADGDVVKSGTTTPRGTDASSGQNVHSIAFTDFDTSGAGYTLTADGETSRPFDIGTEAYDRLRLDAAKFYYTQRSGIAISDELRPGYGRAAGHIGVAPNTGDTEVPCQPGVCDYTLDVSGGWYDAGDHGKYVVNGGISVWQLLSTYERAKLTGHAAELGDGTLDIPESGNGVPDILDEARWELDFLLKMQVPDGQPLAGMAHHKIHDEAWTGLPQLPATDPQKRELHPPSTAATLNLAAAAAQAARVYEHYDPEFAADALRAARKAWAAARANPEMYASEADGIGGGTYSDRNLDDEFYWAAAELFLTTGEPELRNFVQNSPVHSIRYDAFGPISYDWARMTVPARMDLAMLPSSLPDRDQVRRSVIRGADRYLAEAKAQPYGLPYNPDNNMYDWGSSHQVLNNASVLATAYDLTHDGKYRNAALESMDYVMGRNALNISYITGYGEANAHNQHTRWYAHSLDPNLPGPPVGSLSGGANSSIQDPVAQAKLQGCVGQFCYIDDIQSWATNEITINWNSALTWMASFAADQG